MESPSEKTKLSAFLQDVALSCLVRWDGPAQPSRLLDEVVETEELGQFHLQCLPDGLQVAADAHLLVYFMIMKLLKRLPSS